jgi:hypothetical protein
LYTQAIEKTKFTRKDMEKTITLGKRVGRRNTPKGND